jgi:hypothetical protein
MALNNALAAPRTTLRVFNDNNAVGEEELIT